jgi:hypothetical protein
MICYQDRTFCLRPPEECKCHPRRKLTPDLAEDAKRRGLPVAMADLCGGSDPLAPTRHPSEPAILAGAPPAVMAASADANPADVVKAGNVPR